MSNPTVIKKIRKLLRLAQTPGHEGERAAERAKALMERHGLDKVELDEKVRVVMKGVDGEFWLEQILLRVAQTHGCAMQSAEKEGKRFAALYGEKPDVDAAVTLFRKVTLEIAQQCAATRHASFPTMPRGHFAEQIWNRIFCIGAATAVDDMPAEPQKVRSGPMKQADAPPPGEPAEAPKDDAPREKTREELEKERSERELVQLATLIGMDAAVFLQQTAFQIGVDIGRAVVLRSRRGLPERRSLREEGVTASPF